MNKIHKELYCCLVRDLLACHKPRVVSSENPRKRTNTSKIPSCIKMGKGVILVTAIGCLLLLQRSKTMCTWTLHSSAFLQEAARFKPHTHSDFHVSYIYLPIFNTKKVIFLQCSVVRLSALMNRVATRP